MYIFKLNILVQSSENLELESEISMELEELLQSKQAYLISSFSEEITGANHGRCAVCGAWVSNHLDPDFISAFSNGAKIGNKWYCDICLPRDHPVAF